MSLVALLTSNGTGAQEGASILSRGFHVLFCVSVSLQQNYDFPVTHETLLLILIFILSYRW